MIDLFNKKKLYELAKEKDYYEDMCNQKNNTINKLQNEISELHKTTNNLITENKKLIDWVQKILEVNDTQIINERMSRITIPIYKQQNLRAYDMENWKCEEEITDVIIPEIHYRISKGRRY